MKKVADLGQSPGSTLLCVFFFFTIIAERLSQLSFLLFERIASGEKAREREGGARWPGAKRCVSNQH